MVLGHNKFFADKESGFGVAIRCLLALCAICLAVPAVAAQEVPVSPDLKSNEKAGIKLQTVAFEPWDGLQSLVYLSGGDRITLDLPGNRFSDVYRYAGSNPLRFYAPQDLASLKEGELPQPVCEVHLPPSQNILLIFLRLDGPERRYRVIALDSSRTSMPPGVNIFVNLSNFMVLAQIGSRKIQVAPGVTESLPIPASGREKISVPAVFASKSDGEMKTFSSTTWMIDPARRMLTFFYAKPDWKCPAMKGISEYVGNNL